DLQQNRSIAELSGHAASIRALTFDASGRSLAVVTERDVRLWDLSLDYVRVVCPVPESQCTVFDAEGSRLFIASRHRGIQVWNTAFEALTVNFVNWLDRLAAAMDPKEFEASIKSHVPRAEEFDRFASVTADGKLRVRAPSAA